MSSWSDRPDLPGDEQEAQYYWDYPRRGQYPPHHRRILAILVVMLIAAAAVLALRWAADYGDHRRCEKLIHQHAAQSLIRQYCPVDYN